MRKYTYIYISTEGKNTKSKYSNGITTIAWWRIDKKYPHLKLPDAWLASFLLTPISWHGSHINWVTMHCAKEAPMTRTQIILEVLEIPVSVHQRKGLELQLMKQRPRQKLKRLGVALIGLLLHASSVQFW